MYVILIGQMRCTISLTVLVILFFFWGPTPAQWVWIISTWHMCCLVKIQLIYTPEKDDLQSQFLGVIVFACNYVVQL